MTTTIGWTDSSYPIEKKLRLQNGARDGPGAT